LGQPLDPRTDIFSCGAVLYEMATGSLPFLGPSTAAIFDQILHKDPLPAAQKNRAVTAELEKVIAHALAKKKEERYNTARGLADDLKALRRTTTEAVPVAPARRSRYIIAVAVLVAMLAAGGVWALRRNANSVWVHEKAVSEIQHLALERKGIA